MGSVVPFPGRRVDEPTAPRLVSLRELQERFGLSERFFRYRVAEGMPARRYGAALRFDMVEVEKWLEKRGDKHGRN